jgi:hypothetical protein
VQRNTALLAPACHSTAGRSGFGLLCNAGQAHGAWERLCFLGLLEMSALPTHVQGAAADPQVAAALLDYTAAVERYESELQQQYTLAPDMQQQLRVMVERCFDAACTALQQRHAALVETERENARVLNSRCGNLETAARSVAGPAGRRAGRHGFMFVAKYGLRKFQRISLHGGVQQLLFWVGPFCGALA